MTCCYVTTTSKSGFSINIIGSKKRSWQQKLKISLFLSDNFRTDWPFDSFLYGRMSSHYQCEGLSIKVICQGKASKKIPKSIGIVVWCPGLDFQVFNQVQVQGSTEQNNFKFRHFYFKILFGILTSPAGVSRSQQYVDQVSVKVTRSKSRSWSKK